jgi:hypothetical protein
MVPFCKSAAFSSFTKMEFLAASIAELRMAVLVIVVPLPISVFCTMPFLSTHILTTTIPSSLKSLLGEEILFAPRPPKS